MIIDCDVHPLAPEGLAAAYPYLSEAWRRRLKPLEAIDGTENGRRLGQRGMQLARGPYPWPVRKDAIPPTGGAAGSDLDFLRTHHLDRQQIDIAILLPIQAAKVDAFTSPEEAAMVVRGMNDYFADRWLPEDSRFRMAMVVSPHDPAGAAEEIRRFGGTPGVVAIWLPVLNILMGRPYYYPIYEAAEEQGLAILMHPNGQEGDWQGGVALAGGVANYHVERYSLNHELAVSNIGNLIFSGTLERFKKLKFIFIEYGWAWLGPLLWRLDAAWKAGRHSVPWTIKSPTEYVRERIRLTSEPALEVPESELPHVFRTIHAAETLLFSTDYPHWDSDEPGFVFRHVEPELRRRIFAENAIETFGERLEVKVPATI